jgi:hypothetical protein
MWVWTFTNGDGMLAYSWAICLSRIYTSSPLLKSFTTISTDIFTGLPINVPMKVESLSIGFSASYKNLVLPAWSLTRLIFLPVIKMKSIKQIVAIRVVLARPWPKVSYAESISFHFIRKPTEPWSGNERKSGGIWCVVKTG